MPKIFSGVYEKLTFVPKHFHVHVFLDATGQHPTSKNGIHHHSL